MIRDELLRKTVQQAEGVLDVGCGRGEVLLIKNEVEYCRVEINKTLKKSGWPTLTEEEIDGILGGNVARLLKICSGQIGG